MVQHKISKLFTIRYRKGISSVFKNTDKILVLLNVTVGEAKLLGEATDLKGGGVTTKTTFIGRAMDILWNQTIPKKSERAY